MAVASDSRECIFANSSNELGLQGDLGGPRRSIIGRRSLITQGQLDWSFTSKFDFYTTVDTGFTDDDVVMQ